MERIKFDYCLKNKPMASRNSYQLQLIDKIESVIKLMRWKVNFFLTNTYDTKDNMNKETWFQVQTSPWHYKHLKKISLI